MLRGRKRTWRIGLRSRFRPESMHWKHCVSSIIKAHYMLTSDFKEFAALLNSNAVEYMVVGGYALAAYGHPRYTGDLIFGSGRRQITQTAYWKHLRNSDSPALAFARTI